MSPWQSEDREECQHEENETSTIILNKSSQEFLDTISVDRCSDCKQILNLIDSDDEYYRIPMGSSDNCNHGLGSIETVRYQFEYEDGQDVWETITRECSDCGTVIERVNVTLVGKPD